MSGRGHIVKRGNSWRIKVSLGKDSETGKYKSYYETVKGNKKVAQIRLSQIFNELDKGIFVKPSKMMLSDYLKSWLADCCQPVLSPRTFQLYTYTCNQHIVPNIGNISLFELKPQHLQKLYSMKLKEGLSPRTVQLIHVTLSKALKNAVKTELLVKNVATVVTPPKPQKREFQILSETDIHLFLDYARDTEYYSLFYTALFTGMRRAELLGLRWFDIDFNMKQLYVSRSMQYLDGECRENKLQFKEPKSAGSKRLISLGASLIAVLLEHKEKLNKLRLSLNFPKLSETDLVFCHYDGKPMLPNTVTHAWLKCARKSGLSGVRLHDARHTHASLMLKQGVHPKIVQERLGHSSIQLTLDTYSHVVPGMQAAAAMQFDDILLPKNDELIDID